jgi:hypothetical protein
MYNKILCLVQLSLYIYYIKYDAYLFSIVTYSFVISHISQSIHSNDAQILFFLVPEINRVSKCEFQHILFANEKRNDDPNIWNIRHLLKA